MIHNGRRVSEHTSGAVFLNPKTGLTIHEVFHVKKDGDLGKFPQFFVLHKSDNGAPYSDLAIGAVYSEGMNTSQSVYMNFVKVVR